jgi:hypothetical protein
MPSFTLRNEVPPDARQLEVDAEDDRTFHLHVGAMGAWGAEVNLFVAKDDRVIRATVGMLQKPKYDHFVSHASGNDYAYRMTVYQSPDRIGYNAALAYAKAIEVMAGMIKELNEPLEDRLESMRKVAEEQAAQRAEREAEYERERAERRAQWQKQEAERAKAERQRFIERNIRAHKLYENVKWLLEHQFRLTRDGKKSTVFGTIKAVDEPRPTRARGPLYNRSPLIGPAEMNFAETIMHTVSERGKPMRIRLGDITTFDIKYDGEKRFTKIHPN